MAGAEVSFVNSTKHAYYFDIVKSLHGSGLVEMLSGVAAAACGDAMPDSIAGICKGVGLFVDQLVALFEDLPTLGMADNNVVTADIFQEGRGDFTGESTLRLRIAVLCCQLDIAAGNGTRKNSGKER